MNRGVPRETHVRPVRLGNHRNRKSGCQVQARTHAGRNTTVRFKVTDAVASCYIIAFCRNCKGDRLSFILRVFVENGRRTPLRLSRWCSWDGAPTQDAKSAAPVFLMK